MSKLLGLFDIVPGWAYALAIAGLLVVSGTQTVRLSAAKVEVAELKQAAEQDRADRLQLVADHMIDLANVQRDHAATQQEIVDAASAEKLRLQAAHAVDLERVRRVHNAAEAHAAADRAASPSDPAACQRVADRNQALYDLVNEGFGLVVEGRNLLGHAAIDIDTLKRVIANDRERICGGAGE